MPGATPSVAPDKSFYVQAVDTEVIPALNLHKEPALVIELFLFIRAQVSNIEHV